MSKFTVWVLVSVVLFLDAKSKFTKGQHNESTTSYLHAETNVTSPPLPACRVTVQNKSAIHLQNSFGVTHPHFARLKLKFKHHRVQSKDDVILPFHWIWTFYDIHNLASYLKWPQDFPVLSFGLLDVKTLPDGHYLVLDVHNDTQCTLTIGDYETTKSIAKALRDFTQKYLVPIRREQPVDYSYWCYLVRPRNKHSGIVQNLRKYTSYPAEIAQYHCCHTSYDLMNRTVMNVDCDMTPKKQSIDSSMVPFVMSLIAFVFFPIFLLRASYSCSECIMDTIKNYSHLQDSINDSQEPFVYLTGKPPISFTTLLTGFCGLGEKFPVALSRFRRFLFVILTPSLIFVRIYVYRIYMYDIVKAFMKHNCPIGFISMLGGFERSRQAFLTALGGPYILLLVFYVAGIFFLVFPRDLNRIFDTGSNRDSEYAQYSPLFFSLHYLEEYSQTQIADKYGYGKAAKVCTASVFMMVNPKFWLFVVKTQSARFLYVYKCLRRRCRVATATGIFLFAILPVSIMNIIEIILTVALYGFPVINFMYIIVRGYTLCLMKLFTSHWLMTKVGKLRVTRGIISFLFSVCFVYYVFSFCTIFTETFIYIGKTLFFSFLSVVVYPSTSFGYLFFGIVFIFYLIKSLTGFGEGYLELLADAVDLCSQMDNDPFRMQVVDGVLMVEDIRCRSIAKLQIQDTIVDLTFDQKQAIQGSCSLKQTRVKLNGHVLGIPQSLFLQLVRNYRPVHVQVALTFLRVFLIIALIATTFSIISTKPLGSNEDISEVMHVVFLMAIGALPKILEVALDNMNHHVKRDVMLRRMKEDISKYWRDRAHPSIRNTL